MMRRTMGVCVVVLLMFVSYGIGRTESGPGNVGAADGDCQTFTQTGKSACGEFLAYWKANGGLAQQGYPISDVMSEKSETDGNTYQVQYYERAVFEMHPELPMGKRVLLSLLGSQKYKTRYVATAIPSATATAIVASTATASPTVAATVGTLQIIPAGVMGGGPFRVSGTGYTAGVDYVLTATTPVGTPLGIQDFIAGANGAISGVYVGDAPAGTIVATLRARYNDAASTMTMFTAPPVSPMNASVGQSGSSQAGSPITVIFSLNTPSQRVAVTISLLAGDGSVITKADIRTDQAGGATVTLAGVGLAANVYTVVAGPTGANTLYAAGSVRLV